jgi:L-ascorbate metabolism protein UlaG (beta-lactamase superfamily)
MSERRKYLLKKSLSAAAGARTLPPVLFNKLDSFGKSNSVTPAAKPEPEKWKNNEINVSWIGHSTVLINFFGTIILTDPVLFERVGIYIFGLTFGPNRYTAPALRIDEIPKPDLILLSHAHMDHMDVKTLSRLTKLFPYHINCITACNTKTVIEKLKWKSVRELDWGEEHFIFDLHFKAVEVKHFGWRYPWQKDRSKGYQRSGKSYNAYLLEKNGKKILFGGDTAFSDSFSSKDITDIDIAIMPIGAYQPWRLNHCNPEEALHMASYQLNAKHFIPIHCNTFKQGTEPADEPLIWLSNSYKKYKINIGIENIGETFTLAN